MATRSKQAAKAWVGLVAGFVTTIVMAAQQAAQFLTDEYRLLLLSIWDAGEQSEAVTATETAIAQIREQAGDSAFDGRRAADARRIAAAVQSGKQVNGEAFKRDLLTLGWNELLAKCPTVSNKGGAGKKRGKRGKADKVDESKDGIQMTPANIVAYLKGKPAKFRVAMTLQILQTVIDEQAAPAELKREVVKPLETLRKLVA